MSSVSQNQTTREQLLDEYGQADAAPLGTLSELRQKLDAYRAEIERKVRAEVAADFQLAACHQDEFSWGEAVTIAREGLCSCRGGNTPCPKAGAR